MLCIEPEGDPQVKLKEGTVFYRPVIFGDHKTDAVLLKSVIIGYTPDRIHHRMPRYDTTEYYYEDHYVPIGIPTPTYNWLVLQAERETGKTMFNPAHPHAFKWVYARMENNNIDFVIRFRDGDVLVSNLARQMAKFGSNVIGFCQVEILIVPHPSRTDTHILSFKLNKFHFVNKAIKH